MSSLPEDGFVRLRQIIGDRKATPPIPPLIPVSRSSWWDGVKCGRYPAPVRLGPRTTAWRAKDIRRLIQNPMASATLGTRSPPGKFGN